MADLLGLAETAEVLGVERRRIGKWRQLGVVLPDRRRIAFPEPLVVLRATPVWRGQDIRALRDAMRVKPAARAIEPFSKL